MEHPGSFVILLIFALVIVPGFGVGGLKLYMSARGTAFAQERYGQSADHRIAVAKTASLAVTGVLAAGVLVLAFYLGFWYQ
jgi:hypothetical protein